MCGIAGFFDPASQSRSRVDAPAVIVEMTNASRTADPTTKVPGSTRRQE